MAWAWQCERCKHVIGPRGGQPPRFCPRCGERVGGPPLEAAAGWPGPRRTTGLAVSALLLGIVSFFVPFFGLFLAIAATIAGSVAQRRIRNSDGVLRGEGLATAGVVLGILGALFQLGLWLRVL